MALAVCFEGYLPRCNPRQAPLLLFQFYPCLIFSEGKLAWDVGWLKCINYRSSKLLRYLHSLSMVRFCSQTANLQGVCLGVLAYGLGFALIPLSVRCAYQPWCLERHHRQWSCLTTSQRALLLPEQPLPNMRERRKRRSISSRRQRRC
jgi:hypothetical protein